MTKHHVIQLARQTPLDGCLKSVVSGPGRAFHLPHKADNCSSKGSFGDGRVDPQVDEPQSDAEGARYFSHPTRRRMHMARDAR